MSERFETKRCIKALYKYSPFPFLPFYLDHTVGQKTHAALFPAIVCGLALACDEAATCT